jgi:hypothetical protein
MAQAIFRAKPFPAYTPTSSNLVYSTHTYLPMKMEQTECSETLAYKIQTPGNYPKEIIQHSEHGESLKSKMYLVTLIMYENTESCNSMKSVVQGDLRGKNQYFWRQQSQSL